MWEKVTKLVGYRENEWCVMYIDMGGDRCVTLFDTVEEAETFFNQGIMSSRIGIVTTNFYNYYIAE